MAPPRHSAQTGTELDDLRTISLRYPLLSAAPESAGITSWLVYRRVALGYLESDHSTQRLEYLGAPCRLARQVKELCRSPQESRADETANSGTLVMRVKGTENSRQQRR